MSTSPDELRAVARKRVQARRGFQSNLVAFVVVNAGLVAIWWTSGGGYFWPGWVIGFWGVAIVLHAWETFGRRPITKAEVEREAERLRDRGLVDDIDPEADEPTMRRHHRLRS